MATPAQLEGGAGTPAQGSPSTANGFNSPFWTVVLPILSVIGTGIGILGFVIFIGGLVVWSRFNGAGLPANEAVAQLPRNHLVVTGASFLIPALMVALAAVTVALILWDVVVGNRKRRRIAAANQRHTASVTYLEKLKARAERITKQITRLEATLRQQEAAIKEVPPHSPERNDLRDRYDSTDAERNARMKELETLEEEEIPAATQREHDERARLASAPQSDRTDRLLQVAVGGLPLLGAGIIIIIIAWDGINWGQRVLLFVVLGATLALAVVVVTVSSRNNFAWFTLCVFLGVSALITFSAYARAHGAENEVSPVAAIDGTSPVTGYFIAETSDAVYVAQPSLRTTRDSPARGGDELAKLDPEKITLARITKKELTGLTVGPLMQQEPAYRRSIELALTLCRRQAPATSTASTLRAQGAVETKNNKDGVNATASRLRCGNKDIATLQATLESL